MTHHTIPDGYWQNARGDLVPEANVKPEHREEDALVRALVGRATGLSEELAAFKVHAQGEVAALRELIAEKYGATRGGAKGNVTLKSYDGAFEVQVAVGDYLTFGPELQAAKELIDECVTSWSEGANAKLRAIVMDAFQVNKEGRIDTGRVLALRRLDIEDDTWNRAMAAISDAVRVTHTKSYVRFYRIDEAGTRHPISLDIARV